MTSFRPIDQDERFITRHSQATVSNSYAPFGHAVVCTRPGNLVAECVAANVLVLGHTGPENQNGGPIWVDQPNYPGSGADAYGSRHPNKALFLFGDGSVRGIRSTIDPRTFTALSTRSGGEVASDLPD